MPFTGTAALTWEENTVKILNQVGAHRTRKGTDSRRIKETELRADERMGKESTIGEWFLGTLLWGLREMGRALGQHWESRKSGDCLLVKSRNSCWVWCTGL